MAKVMAMAGAAPLIPSSSRTFSQFQLRSIPLPFCGYTKRMHLNLVYPQETVIQPHTRRPLSRPPRVRAESVASDTKELLDVKEWNKQFRDARLKHLEAQALDAFKKAVDTFRNITFPCALIAGDVVILDLLERLGFLSNGKVKVVFIDTFHLFPETYSFLKQMEERYNFQAHIFHAAGVNSKSDYLAKYDSDFYLRDIDEYDKICKVEPFDRALATLEVELMINGRRRDHGADRAHLEVLEGGKIFKLQPLAYWEFRDCWDYLLNYKIPYHPLHDQGFPSIGDVQSTVPVPKEKWFEYGGERSGRFQDCSACVCERNWSAFSLVHTNRRNGLTTERCNDLVYCNTNTRVVRRITESMRAGGARALLLQGLTNKDGSLKTECGIHVESK